MSMEPSERYGICVKEGLFKRFLQVENASLLPKLQTEKILLQKGQIKLIDQLVSLFCHVMKESGKKEWIFDSECKIDDDLRFLVLQEITENKNHALLSALTLLNMILGDAARFGEGYLEKAFSTEVYPAALAIALHDKEVLDKLPKNKNVAFESMPLALLLIYCDTAQEFGRAEQKEYCTLKNFNLGKNIVETMLAFYKKSVYKRKEKDVDDVFGRLKSNSLSFKLRLVFDEEEYLKAITKPV